ncbi:MAG: glycosyltransferase family 2 protein [Ardenticatenia bacterium]|nr:glycosyltransferase family 2 protein [Ardenticatenia bacterium]
MWSAGGARASAPDISAVVVSWNVRDLLARCLQSVEHSAGLGGVTVELVVVDNASHDGTPTMLKEIFPHAHVVALAENRGYAAGVNVGLRVARGRHLLVLNPDTEALNDAVPQLVRFLDDHPAVGAVGPALIYPDGAPQPSRRRFPPLPVLFFQDTTLHGLARPWLGRFFMDDIPATTPHPVDWLVGAVLAVRREAIESVGGMDETFFMYFEEVDWLRRMKAAGWSVWFLPQATFVHHEGASSGQVIPLRHAHYARSRIRYAERWHGLPTAKMLWGWLMLHFGWQLALEWAKGRVGHKPRLRRARVAAYGHVLQILWRARPSCACSS